MGADVKPRVVCVFVVDDHSTVMDGGPLAVQNTCRLRVAGYDRGGREALAAVQKLRPDVVLLDLRLSDMVGMLDTDEDAERANLLAVIRRVVADEQAVDDDTEDSSEAMLVRRLRDHGLTKREYEILRRVAMGETNPEIAAALGLTRNTVKTYLQRALEKLGARNRVEALARANQLGIL
jgi:two-component system, NarL family, nitrate/nitrite response regulator NarL